LLSAPVPEDLAWRYLELGATHAGLQDSEASVTLKMALAVWGHGYPESPRLSEDGADELKAAREAGVMAKRVGRIDVASGVLDCVGSVLQHHGRTSEATEVIVERLALAGQVSDPWELADIYAMAAMHFQDIGRYREADEAGTKGHELL